MRILLTGHRGYIGVVLAPVLMEQGHEVVGLDTDYFARCTFGGMVPEMMSIIKDVRDVEPSDLRGYDAVIHLAGLSNDPLGDFRPELTEQINEHASIRLARLAKAAGVARFLFASSCSAYGAAGDEFLHEESSFNPVTPYGRSKAAVEVAVRKLADADFSPTFLRASTAYGVSARLRFDLVLNNLTAWAFTTGRVHLKSDGSPWRPIVHIEDIARAYTAVVEAPREQVHNQAFNVGVTTENYRIRELAQIVRDTVPGCVMEFEEGAGPDARCYRVDCNKIATVLHGYKPQWTARRGVVELYEIYRRVGLTLEEFEGERFKRIAHIKKLIAEGRLDRRLRWQTAQDPAPQEEKTWTAAKAPGADRAKLPASS